MSGPVAFQILGPLRVEVAGRAVAPIGSRARTVLSVLLLHAGQSVTAEQLVAALWTDGAPPPTARTQLHMLLSRLRKTLLGHPVIETRPGAYRIDTRVARLDSHHAERLIEEGRRLGDPVLYGRALALWRGPVLDGFDHAEVRRLEELRLTAVGEWAALELGRGCPSRVAERLAPMVADLPYHESLRAQLVLALDRLNRRQEALHVLREGTRLLDRELGLEPGPELRRAEQLVRGRTPAQLPPAVAAFTGRDGEVERLCGLLTDGGEHVVAVSGPAGIGKSALAVQVAHRLAGLFPDGQLYVNLHGSTPDTEPAATSEVLGRFLRALGATVPADQEEAAAAFRSMTHGKRILVLLDNAAGPEQVRDLLPGSATCGVLVTSRRLLGSVDAARHHPVEGLPPDEAVALLGRLAGTARVGSEPEAAAEIAELCGRLPLALTIAGAKLAGQPGLSVRALAGRLAVEQRRLAELALHDQAVRTSFMVSYQDLGDAAAARLFRLLGLLDVPDVGVPVAAALAGLPEQRAAVLLDRLAENQLVQSDVPGRFHLHDLLRLFARERAAEEETGADRTGAVRRALHCYVATARHATLVVEPTIGWRIDFLPGSLDHPGVPLGSRDEVDEWIDAETDNLVAAARQAASGIAPEVAPYLSACLNAPLEGRGRRREQLTLAYITRTAARLTGDRRHAGLADNDLGWALHWLSKAEEALACFDRALRAWAGYDAGTALALHGRGVVLRVLERYEESLESLERARAAWHRLGHARQEAGCLTGVGLTCQRLGRHDDAVAAHEAAIGLARDSAARVTEVMALGNLGEAHRLAGRREAAAACFTEALRLDRLRGLSGTYWEAEHLWGLGRVRGDRALLNRSAAILRDLDLIDEAEAGAIATGPAPRTPAAIADQL